MGKTTRYKVKPLIAEVRTFVRHHLGNGVFAPFTGQDEPAWCAFVHLVKCYSHGGGHSAMEAMAMTIRCAQPNSVILAPFVQVIPAVMDWTTVAQLWPVVIARADHETSLGLRASKMHLLKAVERNYDRTAIVRSWGA